MRVLDVVASFALLLPAVQARADCIAPTLEDALAQSDVVFRGTVVGAPDDCAVDCFYPDAEFDWFAIVPSLIEVSTVWKGAVAQRTQMSGFAYQNGFFKYELGLDAVFFGEELFDSGTYRSGCMLHHAPDEPGLMEFLGDGGVPIPDAGPSAAFCPAPLTQTQPASFAATNPCVDWSPSDAGGVESGDPSSDAGSVDGGGQAEGGSVSDGGAGHEDPSCQSARGSGWPVMPGLAIVGWSIARRARRR